MQYTNHTETWVIFTRTGFEACTITLDGWDNPEPEEVTNAENEYLYEEQDGTGEYVCYSKGKNVQSALLVTEEIEVQFKPSDGRQPYHIGCIYYERSCDVVKE